MKFEGASRFPTRNFPYHRNASGLSRDGLADPLKDTPTGAAARFILGIDRKASVLDPRAEASPVNDAFAKLVLAPGHRPETLLSTTVRRSRVLRISNLSCALAPPVGRNRDSIVRLKMASFPMPRASYDKLSRRRRSILHPLLNSRHHWRQMSCFACPRRSS